MPVAGAFLLLSCTSKNNDGEKARADYDRALSDSIEIVRQEIDSCNSQITVLRDQVNACCLILPLCPIRAKPDLT